MVPGSPVGSRREVLGLSQEALAAESGVALARLREIESGAEPFVSELVRLGRVLVLDPAVLARPLEASEEARVPIRFRAPEGIDYLEGRDALKLARASQLGQIGRFLWARLRAEPPAMERLRRTRPIDPTVENWQEGYKLGAAARAALAPTAGPLLSVQGLLESLGVHVTWAAFETPGITAVSMYEREALPVIVLNRASPRAGRPMSRRAALAHELCHLLHDGQAVDLLTMVSRYDARDPIEQRANGFAPSFLAPRTMLNLTSQTPEALVRELAEGWGFTMEGAAWHAKNCGLIDGESAEALAGSGTQIGRGAFEPHEPQFLGMAGGLILSLVEEAVAKDVISEGRLREILSGE